VDVILVIFLVVLAIFAYFLPFVIALVRGHRYKSVIFVLNLIGGWSGLGWVAAFIWAVWPSGGTVTDVVTHDPTGLSSRNLGTAAGEFRNEYDRTRVSTPRPHAHGAPAVSQAPRAVPCLAFDVATKAGARRFMSESLPCVIGSGVDADVRIRHPSVAGQHVVVRSMEGGVVVTAISESSPLSVGGGPVRRCNVPFGGSFKIGEVTLQVRMVDPDEIELA
jgi:hypothetical protein